MEEQLKRILGRNPTHEDRTKYFEFIQKTGIENPTDELVLGHFNNSNVSTYINSGFDNSHLYQVSSLPNWSSSLSTNLSNSVTSIDKSQIKVPNLGINASTNSNDSVHRRSFINGFRASISPGKDSLLDRNIMTEAKKSYNNFKESDDSGIFGNYLPGKLDAALAVENKGKPSPLAVFQQAYLDKQIERLKQAGKSRSEASDILKETTEPNKIESKIEGVSGGSPTPIDPSNIKVPDFGEKLKELSEDNKSFGEKVTGFATGQGGLMLTEGLNVANKAFTALAGERSEFNGKEGALAKGLDSTYDTIQEAAGKFGPWGKVVQLGMAANKLMSNAVGKLGGGTDGMTKTDAILGSPFFQMTPLGLINGFGGSNANTITKDQEAFARVGSSYAGSSGLVDDSLLFSGKKYGLFSSGALSDVNGMIYEANRQQNMIDTIGLLALDRFNLSSYMGSTSLNAYNLSLGGGYNLSSVRIGRHGMVVRAKKIISFQKYNLFKLGGILTEKCIEPSIVSESKVEFISEFKEGGSLLNFPSIINEVEIEFISEFKEGGSFNIIPEGALHARLHHMDNAEHLTKKGIPVVDNLGELQAEIELGEIILRLEVTKKLEELAKENTDESAIEAGKLLVNEILHNTIDNTKNLI